MFEHYYLLEDKWNPTTNKKPSSIIGKNKIEIAKFFGRSFTENIFADLGCL